MSEQSLLVMAILVVVALAFDFMNGFHDAANSIALMVSTRLDRKSTRLNSSHRL